MKSEGAFQIFADDYVTDDSGTGVVHSAPAFGEVSLSIDCACWLLCYVSKKV